MILDLRTKIFIAKLRETILLKKKMTFAQIEERKG
jgi:hypothetical protein